MIQIFLISTSLVRKIKLIPVNYLKIFLKYVGTFLIWNEMQYRDTDSLT